MEHVERFLDLLEKDDISSFIYELFDKAIELRASDIHIEPYKEYSIIRIRIDGKLIHFLKYKKEKHSQIITKVKILAKMDISEKRLPQDGSINLNRYLNIDFRVSSLNTVNGEKIEIRILSFEEYSLNSNLLGFSESSKNKLSEIIKSKSGMIIFSGPTGSGKSTSLYSLLNKLNSKDINIVTVEDPVEYHIDGINQIEVNESIGLGFDTILKSILRQDPDIVMIGEIRDTNTAKMAIRASITGHLVLTTLHTNDALSSIIRLKDLGIEDYLLSSTISAVCSQRLVRKLCDCKEKTSFKENELRIVSQFRKDINKDTIIYKPKGCEKCNSGYFGREAIEEVYVLNDNTKQIIKNGNYTLNDLKNSFDNNKNHTLFESAIDKVLEGKTSFDEIINVLYDYNIINMKI